jgi:hypothetical protein
MKVEINLHAFFDASTFARLELRLAEGMRDICSFGIRQHKDQRRKVSVL